VRGPRGYGLHSPDEVLISVAPATVRAPEQAELFINNMHQHVGLGSHMKRAAGSLLLRHHSTIPQIVEAFERIQETVHCGAAIGSRKRRRCATVVVIHHALRHLHEVRQVVILLAGERMIPVELESCSIKLPGMHMGQSIGKLGKVPCLRGLRLEARERRIFLGLNLGHGQLELVAALVTSLVVALQHGVHLSEALRGTLVPLLVLDLDPQKASNCVLKHAEIPTVHAVRRDILDVEPRCGEQRTWRTALSQTRSQVPPVCDASGPVACVGGEVEGPILPLLLRGIALPTKVVRVHGTELEGMLEEFPVAADLHQPCTTQGHSAGDPVLPIHGREFGVVVPAGGGHTLGQAFQAPRDNLKNEIQSVESRAALADAFFLKAEDGLAIGPGFVTGRRDDVHAAGEHGLGPTRADRVRVRDAIAVKTKCCNGADRVADVHLSVPHPFRDKCGKFRL